jgi:hypothetical protein
MDGRGGVRGFSLGRFGTRFDHLGPLCGADPATAAALLRHVSTACGNRPTIIDVPQRDHEWMAVVAAAGFREQRPFMRMYRGQNPCPGDPGITFAVAGPEFG